MKSIIPYVIRDFIPVEMYEQSNEQVFELILDSILTSGIIKDNSTRHTVIDALLIKARTEKHIKMLKDWFEGGKVFNSKGENLTDVELSLRHKHTIMEKIWSSFEISLDEKERLLSILES